MAKLNNTKNNYVSVLALLWPSFKANEYGRKILTHILPKEGNENSLKSRRALKPMSRLVPCIFWKVLLPSQQQETNYHDFVTDMGQS